MSTKCQHGPCTCDSEGKAYCSTHCSTATNMEEEPTWCECGHAACEARPEHPTAG